MKAIATAIPAAAETKFCTTIGCEKSNPELPDTKYGLVNCTPWPQPLFHHVPTPQPTPLQTMGAYHELPQWPCHGFHHT